MSDTGQTSSGSMGTLRLHLTSSYVEDLAGTPIIVEILDHGLRAVQRPTVRINEAIELPLNPGVYAVRVNLPSGQTITESLTIEPRASTPLQLSMDRLSTHEWLEHQAVLKPTTTSESGSLDTEAYKALWLRLWTRENHQWRIVPFAPDWKFAAPDAVRLRLASLPRKQHLLQVGAHSVPWKFVALPAGTPVDVVLRPSQSGRAEHPLLVDVIGANLAAESLLGYLSLGNMRAAQEVAANALSAEELLYGKWADPAAAAVAVAIQRG